MNATELHRYLLAKKEQVDSRRPKPFGLPISEQIGFHKGWDACMEVILFYVRSIEENKVEKTDKPD